MTAGFRLSLLLLIALLMVSAALPTGLSAQPAVADVTQSAQLDFTVEYGDLFASLTNLSPAIEQRVQLIFRNAGNGAAVGDYDNDGDLDVYLLGQLGLSNRLFRNNLEAGSKTFTDVTAAPLDDLGMSRVAHFADLDNDGFLDLVLVNDDEGSGDYPSSKLFRNDGGMGFIDVTPGSGFEPFGYPHLGTSLADYDGDGLLDIYLTVWTFRSSAGPVFPGTNQLFRNLGNFVFEEATQGAGLGGMNFPSATAVFADFDEDSDPDLYVAVGSRSDAFYWNHSGVFNEAAVDVGLTHVGNDVGAALADFDDDDDLDLYVTNITQTHNVLHVHEQENGATVFTDEAVARGVEDSSWGWGVEFLDAENDGDLDLVVVTGSDEWALMLEGPSCAVCDTPTYLYVNDGTGHYKRRQTRNTPDSRAVIAFDYDRDGDQDLLITNIDEPVLLLENVSSGAGNWLTVIPEPHHRAVGSRLYATIGGVTKRRDIVVGRSFLSGTPAEAHFGLGDATEVESLRVVWPDGSEDLFGQVAANQILRIRENAQHSVARQWNEETLDAIRIDFARPTVHARNLYHGSVAMWDAWAAYDQTAGQVLHQERAGAVDVEAARAEAISFAVYRLLSWRFADSPGAATSLQSFDDKMDELGYDRSFTSTVGSTPAALGNRIADTIIAYGLRDYANEAGGYGNLYYQPVNPPLLPVFPGNPDLVDPNRWQPLALEYFIDQGGNPIPGGFPDFLSPEWGQVKPFSLSTDDLTIYNRGGFQYWIYHDPGPPPLLSSAEYKSGFEQVVEWSGFLVPTDGVTIDISPASRGDNTLGTNDGDGHDVNPHAGLPYEPNIVPAGDYYRVLAEFWADGPDSETPPGHWFTIANYVSDHPEVEKSFGGVGPVLGDLEWDVKVYLALGGAMHDVAIAAWGAKGWYDYIRPISAIRHMCDNGQSSNPSANAYHPDGINLHPGYIELVTVATTAPGGIHEHLAGAGGEYIGKIAVHAWRGPDYIVDPATDTAGVGWILCENWWPYQRPSFVTPPFAGYVSGHSTYSRAAAEVMTLLTGDPFFPGGMGTFEAPQNEFLVFEEGPSVDITLQWATYADASDETSLSRIYGGIHPTADDIPGRLIGAVIGPKAFHHAERYFSGELGVPPPITAQLTLVKHVTTDDSGTASASDWLLSAAGPTPISGQGGVDSGVAAGTYALSESGGPAGYSASAWVCLGGSQNGNQITLTEGEAATCTITNDDNSLAHLRLVKQVTTDDGGAASPGDWQLSAAGPTPISGQGGIDSDVAAGTYVLSEFGGPPGYTASAWVCVGGNQSGNQITLTEGESATCTVTNDDDPVISTHFVDVTESALVSHTHATTQTIFFPSELPSATMDEVAIMGTKAEVTSSWITGGVAAGDYDGDGLPDMFVAGGDAGTSRLFQNRGDGTFENKAAVAGVEITGERTAGAVFADYDGDGDLDLFVGGAVGTSPRLFRNNGPNTEGEITFVDVFATAFPSFDLIRAPNTWGGAFGDYDLDGDLDLFLPHDMTPFGPSVDSSVHGSTQHLWRNNGDETFTDVSVDSGISALFAGDVRDETFTPNFADVDEDGYPDLLIVADRAASLVLINQRDGTFEDETDHSAFLSPVNGRGKVAGMGGSVGDYDRDGSLDWFVSQIRRRRDSHRLFRSEGNATFHRRFAPLWCRCWGALGVGNMLC